ncbi:tol-pal system protein YbgF [Sinimarinibacterium sp. NLF-5-8]|uniref:tol-pal system protein YbgF n=1 Tax=Sinimarinibacterium sp. NLF-5-8 TaxID=2698684 RepID=UPI00137BAD5A|nr:tol-pal system protein YbgF [Sinimarinibacterium sp. NLF-5-8]QHS08752.1 tol-pal system protein YbgF [Sinimarinibacterium sp. NLF-5-8]
MNLLRLTLLSCAALTLSACAAGSYGGSLSSGSDNLSPAERRLQSVESRVADISRRLDAVNLAGMDQENLRLRDDLRSLRGEVERLRFDVEQMQKRARDQYMDIDRRLQVFEGGAAGNNGVSLPVTGARVEASGTLTTAPGAVTNPVRGAGGETIAAPVVISSGGGGTPEEEAAYLTAFDSLKNGKYDDALKGFNAMLAKWPQGRYADNALYWSGEAHYVKRDYKSALNSFQSVMQKFPNSPKAADAMLKVGFSQMELKQVNEGRATLQSLISKYPQSNAAKLAQQRLGN